MTSGFGSVFMFFPFWCAWTHQQLSSAYSGALSSGQNLRNWSISQRKYGKPNPDGLLLDWYAPAFSRLRSMVLSESWCPLFYSYPTVQDTCPQLFGRLWQSVSTKAWAHTWKNGTERCFCRMLCAAYFPGRSYSRISWADTDTCRIWDTPCPPLRPCNLRDGI